MVGLTCGEMVDAARAGELDVFHIVGGNFLDTLPDLASMRAVLARVPLRLHQDSVVTTQMLLDPANTVVLLPAATWYEQRAGGTETSTERKIISSPLSVLPAGEAHTEWEILAELAARVVPDRVGLVRFADGWRIAEEISRVVPGYDGIRGLRRAGDRVQWDGRSLCRDGRFPTPDGRAVLTPFVSLDTAPPGVFFVLRTRRGRQFNSMIQGDRDPLNGARRDDVLIGAGDAAALGLREGDPVVIRSAAGDMRARVKLARSVPRCVRVRWPGGTR